MIETHLRPGFQRRFIDPVVNRLCSSTIIKPKHITIFSIIFGVFSAVCIIADWFVLGTVALLLSGYCDALDGSLARSMHATSNSGATLDLVGDRLVECAVMFALFIIAPMQSRYVVFMMLGASYLCVTTFLVVGVFSDNESEKSFYYSPGLMERAEAFIFFILMLWLSSWFLALGWLYASLVFYTAGRRMFQFMSRSSVC